MRVFYGGLSNETNAFSPLPCGVGDFAPFTLARDPASRSQIFGALLNRGAELIEGVNLVAQPAGPIASLAYTELRDRLLGEIAQSGPLDAVLLNLHGAMAAEDIGDCEGDILRRVRELVGPTVFIGAVLDPHCHLSASMLSHSDLLTIYKEYPHTDIAEATAQLVEVCAQWLDEPFTITHSVFDCQQIDIYYTTSSPMREQVTYLRQLESTPGVLAASIAHGFPWGDDPELGARTLVYTRADQVLAENLATSLGKQVMSLRGLCGPRTIGPDDAVRRVAVLEGLSVLADVADNPGGGAPGDSTFLIHALLQHPGIPSAVAALWDPENVAMAHKAGVGAVLQMSIGGRFGDISGPPVVGEVVVTGLKRRHYEPAPGYGGLHVAFGDLAAVEIGDVTIVLASRRSQVFSPGVFTAVGVDLAATRAVIVKSTQHFRAGFDPVATRTFYVDTPGALSLDFARIPYRKAPRDLWPLNGARR